MLSICSAVLGKIACVQGVVAAFLGDQLVVGAALDDAALLQNHDDIRVFDGGKPATVRLCISASMPR